MNYFLKPFICLLLFVVCNKNSFSQDIKGAVLQLQHLYSLKYEATVQLYVDANINQYRPYVIIDWGVSKKPAYFSHETLLPNGLIKKVFVGTEMFPGPGYHQISCTDSFRIADIKNIISSETKQIKVDAELIISPFFGNPNNSPIIFNQQQNVLNNGGTFIYEPNAWDPDGDSLSFELIPCYSQSYYLPPNTFIDTENGAVSSSPDTIGLYAYSVRVKEWRTFNNNQPMLVGSITYDFIIDVTSINSIENSNADNNNINLYPNPASNSITVEWSKEVQVQSLAVFDYLGREVLNEQLNNNTHSLQIDVSALPQGMYFLHLQTEKDLQTAKFVKQ